MVILMNKSKELQELLTLAQQKIDSVDKQSAENNTEKNRLADYDLAIQKRENAVISREGTGKVRSDELNQREDVIKVRESELGNETDKLMRMREETIGEAVSAKKNFENSKEIIKSARNRELESDKRASELDERDKDLAKREQKYMVLLKEFMIKDKNVDLKAKELKLQYKGEKLL